MAKRPPLMILDESAVNVFTDGSSYSTPRRGGIGYRIVTVDDSGSEVTHRGSSPHSLNATASRTVDPH